MNDAEVRREEEHSMSDTAPDTPQPTGDPHWSERGDSEPRDNERHESSDAVRAQQEPHEESAKEESGRSDPAPDVRPTDERIRILNMVAEGRISTADAVELLKALQPVQAGDSDQGMPRGRSPRVERRFFGPEGPFGPKGPFGPEGPLGPRGPFNVRIKPPVPPTPPMPPDVFVRRPRTLLFEVRDGERRVHARLPLGLVESVDRFLPRQVRQALEESEVDLEQLVDLVNNLDEHVGDSTLIDIRDEDEKRVVISVE